MCFLRKPLWNFPIVMWTPLVPSIHFIVLETLSGITCEAIEEASRFSKAIDERIIMNCAVIAQFRKKLIFSIFMTKCHDMSWYIMICHDLSCYNMICMTKCSYFVLTIALLFYRLPIFSIDSNSVLSLAILFYSIAIMFYR